MIMHGFPTLSSDQISALKCNPKRQVKNAKGENSLVVFAASCKAGWARDMSNVSMPRLNVGTTAHARNK
jgi:hypothetical protein